MSSQREREQHEKDLYNTALTDGDKEIPQPLGQSNDPQMIAADVTLAYDSRWAARSSC